jgi:autotransporter-associated beta strand protein
MKTRNNPLLRSASCPIHLRAAAFAIAAVACTSALYATTFNWDGGSTTSNTWGTADNWDPNVAPIFNTTADLVFNVLTRPDNDLGAARTIRSIAYGADIDGAFTTNLRTFTPGGAAAALTMDADAGNASITVDAGATGNINLGWNGVGTAGGALTLTDTLDVTHNGSGELLISRQIAGAGGITKLGTGTMRVAAANANTFTGAVNVNGGRLILGSTSAAGADLNTSSGITLGGGILEIRTTSALNKSVSPNLTVSSASTLAYNNTTAATQSLTIANLALPAPPTVLPVNANLKVQNISTDTTLNNLINISRNLTGSGNVIVETYNNLSAIGGNFSLGRVQLSGDNSGWSGNLVIAKGTAQLSGAGTSSGTGSITIGTTGDAFGAGLGFNLTPAYTLANNITVTTGGFRGIKSNNVFNTSIAVNGAITLNGNLTIDHGLDAGFTFTLGGNNTGAGGLNITRTQGNTGSSLIVTGSNTYLGNTTVSTDATLVLSGSLTSNVSVATGARFGGSGGSTTQGFNLAAGANFIFLPGTSTVFNVSGTASLDNSFGVASLVGDSQGLAIDWSLVPAGTYTLIGTTPSNFNNISNFGIANAVTVAAGKTAHFQNGGGLQLVVTEAPADPYITWSNGSPFDVDANNDGVVNGLAWFLGALNKDANANDLVPKASQTAGALVLEFNCLSTTDLGAATFAVQYSSDLGQLDPWAETVIPGTVGTFTAGVVDFEVTDPAPPGGLLKVVATIPAGEAASGKLFGRVSGKP